MKQREALDLALQLFDQIGTVWVAQNKTGEYECRFIRERTMYKINKSDEKLFSQKKTSSVSK